MFFKKETPQISIPDLVTLNAKLDQLIFTWAKIEIGAGIKPGTKLDEIVKLNSKLILSSHEHGAEMRSFLANEHTVGKILDFTFSRLQDLYVEICTTFPPQFITNLHNNYIASLRELKYDIDDDIASSYKLGWLIAKVQLALRYHTSKT